MDDDDTDDKIRRNFIVLTSLICATWMLDLDLAKVAMGFLKIDPSALSSADSNGRIWLLLAVMLGYFSHRYQYTKAWSSATAAANYLYQQQLIKTVDPKLLAAGPHQDRFNQMLIKARADLLTARGRPSFDPSDRTRLTVIGTPLFLGGLVCFLAVNDDLPSEKKYRTRYWLPCRFWLWYPAFHFRPIIDSVQSTTLPLVIVPLLLGSGSALYVGHRVGTYWLAESPLIAASGCATLLVYALYRTLKYLSGNDSLDA